MFARYDAPTNMRAFYGPSALRRLRLVWMVREPVGKFWSYFWDLKSYATHTGFEPQTSRADEQTGSQAGLVLLLTRVSLALDSYGGDWDRVTFAAFVAPKLAKAKACLQKD